ncbi:O-linked N-acetylglucosamine transferase, SPINDLY family protein [Luteimonas sp. e5]
MDDSHHARERHLAGDIVGAEHCYQSALQHQPHDWLLRHDYAVLLLQTGRPAPAIPLLEAIPPGAECYPQAILALTHCQRATGRLDAGVRSAHLAVEALPQQPASWLLLGSLLSMSGQHVQAEKALRRALDLAPGLAEAWHYLGESLQACKRYVEAASAYRQAAKTHPGEWLNIGICAELQGDLETARTCFIEMDRHFPDRMDNLVRLAHVCAQLCRMHECDAVVERLRRLDAGGAGGTELAGIEPFPLTYLPLAQAFKQRALAAHAQRVVARANAFASLPVSARHEHGRIRLGYISPDLGNHAVGSLLQEHFHAHDRERFEVTAYSLRAHEDAHARRIAAGVEHFVDASEMPDQALARRIRDDGIDVLIDLGGYTQGARPAALALRPAPIQLGWLGFIHAQEAPWLDGIILDHWIAPPDQAWPYTDRIYHMRSPVLPGWQVACPEPDRTRFSLPPLPTPLLASFNNSYKLDIEVLSAWSRILARAGTARLLLFLRGEQARTGFLASWASVGGDPSRLLFADAVPWEAQLVRASSCDLFLDAFRYQAGATSMFAIASALPVLSLPGDSPTARLGSTANHHLGMHELIATNVDEYVETAVALANDRDRLDALRGQLQTAVAHGDLFSPRRGAAEIERIAMLAMERSKDSLMA